VAFRGVTGPRIEDDVGVQGALPRRVGVNDLRTASISSRFEDVIVQKSPARPLYSEHSFVTWSSPFRGMAALLLTTFPSAIDGHPEPTPADDLRLTLPEIRLPLRYPRSRADVAQSVEHQLPKLRVAGSIPVVRSKKGPGNGAFLRLVFRPGSSYDASRVTPEVTGPTEARHHRSGFVMVPLRSFKVSGKTVAASALSLIGRYSVATFLSLRAVAPG